MKKVIFGLLIIAFILPSAALAADKGELVVCSWGGIFEKAQRKALFEPFEKETGIKVIVTTSPILSRVKAMVLSGNVEWDLVFIAGGIYMPLLKQGLLEKMDYKYFDPKVLDEVYDEAKGEYMMGSFYFSVVNAYSTKAFPGDSYPKNWADFWNVKKFPGPRCLTDMSTDGGGWEFALLAEGVPKDQIYQSFDMDRVFKKLSEIKPHVVKWWSAGAVTPQLLVDGEITAGSSYNGRVYNLKKSGAPLNFHWNEGKLYLEYACIPKGAKNYENAMKFIAWHLQAKPQADMTIEYSNGPVNKNAFQYIPKEMYADLPSYQENKEKQFFINEDWFADNAEKVIERWNKWVLEK